MPTYVEDVKGLVNAALLVEREPRIDLSRDLARHDLQDLAAELHKQVVQCSIDLLVHVLAMGLAVLNSLIDELGVFGFLGGRKDEGWVGGGILRLVLVDGGEVTTVADDGLLQNWLAMIRAFGEGAAEVAGYSDTYGAGGLQLVKRRSHLCNCGGCN